MDVRLHARDHRSSARPVLVPIWSDLDPLYIATAGIIFSVMLMSALMGLVFLSSGTGHDEAIEDPFADLADDENEQHRP